jgi:hypothetical protein
MNTTTPLPVHKRAWLIFSVVIFLMCLDFIWKWPMTIFIRIVVVLVIEAGAIFVGWLLQFLWGFIISVLPKSPPRSLKQKIFVWIIRAIYVSVIFAMCDACSLSIRRQPLFSTCLGMSGNGDAAYLGLGYILVNHADTYRDGGRTLGPEVWFWFAPCVISETHGKVEVHWLWNR